MKEIKKRTAAKIVLMLFIENELKFQRQKYSFT